MDSLEVQDAPIRLFRVAQTESSTKRIVTSLMFSACGDYLVAGSDDDMIRIFVASPSAAQDHSLLVSRDAAVGSFYFAKTGVAQAVFAGNRADRVLITPRNRNFSDVLRFDVNRGVIDGAYHAAEVSTAEDGVDGADFCSLVHSPTSLVFAAAKENGFCSFFHPTCSQPIATLEEPAQGLPVMDFSRDGRTFAFADNWSVRLYDWREASRGPFGYIETIQVDANGYIRGLHFNPSTGGRDLLLTTSTMLTAHVSLDGSRSEPRLFRAAPIWRDDPDISSEVSIITEPFMHCKRPLHCTAKWSPDGQHVATGTAGAMLLITSGCKEQGFGLECKLKAHTATVTNVAWNPRYQILASACTSLQLWGYKQNPRPATPAERSDVDRDVEV